MDKIIYLTFDMEWVCDGILEYLLELMCELDIKGTIFVTHETKFLDKYRESQRFELGIHPNFNFLLQGTQRDGMDYNNIIKGMKSIVPEALCSRSHGLTQSTLILNALMKNNIQYDLNTYISPNAGSSLLPYFDGGIMRVPFIFEDDLYLRDMGRNDRLYSVDYYLGNSYQMLKIFNFHPMQIFLNIENEKQYKDIKPFYNDFNYLCKHRNMCHKDGGIEVFLRNLVKRAKEQNFEFQFVKNIAKE